MGEHDGGCNRIHLLLCLLPWPLVHLLLHRLLQVSTMKGMSGLGPAKVVRPPKNPLRHTLYRLVNSTAFDSLISAVIIANIGAMTTDYWGIEQNEVDMRNYAKLTNAFATIYYAEAAIKLTALGCGGYFSNGWCQFDFFLVCRLRATSVTQHATNACNVCNVFRVYSRRHVYWHTPPPTHTPRTARCSTVTHCCYGAHTIRYIPRAARCSISLRRSFSPSTSPSRRCCSGCFVSSASSASYGYSRWVMLMLAR